jgi:putative phosphoribosyl transferase
MRAAVMALRERDADAIVVAVPTSSPQACAELGEAADDIVCARMPERFLAVGQWYRDFSPTTDDEVRGLLERVRTWPAGTSRGPEPAQAAEPYSSTTSMTS